MASEMMARRRGLTITVDAYLRRIAWLEYYGLASEAAALRELAASFDPPYLINEIAVARHKAELEKRWPALHLEREKSLYRAI